MLHSIDPVLPVAGVSGAVSFWAELGFKVEGDTQFNLDSSTTIVRRGDITVHLRRCGAEGKSLNPAPLRLEVASMQRLNRLYTEWLASGAISASLSRTGQGTVEFDIETPDGAPVTFFTQPSH